ncbi:LysR family transcriptional regulator ArgP [Shewanella eurypsychrophilus]|uniref:LysR family transcriptional regulator ArgP n=1 Tax=Shewanella eurypsychrophilus TaxID=2593656 RepID=A0ABX6V927_9GAMM|nr:MULTISPECIES: LysR family transcriptional regulator ArgP [Shewanella]QFU23067.1 ArgP/LysG family DNA-binding transcriptional regulator [Shewanella sp. YLB-09]QPG58350.1 LysR family transcriptional regulator ArgP [Shewanella eurypsychrophilus]
MLDYAHLRALSIVVSEGGFERAAKVLCITQSAVSQRIKQLEERVGQALVIRSTPVEATPTGKRLLRHFSQVELLESELRVEMDVDDPNLPTIVKIAVNADSLATWFLPALCEVFKRHQWLLELVVDDESYTHNLLKNGEAVGCVTTTKRPLAGCSSEYLGDMEYLCVATPEFIQRFFPITVSQASLELAPAVVFSTKDKLHEKYLNKYFKMKAGSWREHKIPSSESFLDAILQGLGYGLVGHLQAEPLLEKGLLIEITPNKRKRVPLYWQHWNIKAKQTTIIYRSLAVTAKQSLCHNESFSK